MYDNLVAKGKSIPKVLLDEFGPQKKPEPPKPEPPKKKVK